MISNPDHLHWDSGMQNPCKQLIAGIWPLSEVQNTQPHCRENMKWIVDNWCLNENEQKNGRLKKGSRRKK